MVARQQLEGDTCSWNQDGKSPQCGKIDRTSRLTMMCLDKAQITIHDEPFSIHAVTQLTECQGYQIQATGYAVRTIGIRHTARGDFEDQGPAQPFI